MKSGRLVEPTVVEPSREEAEVNQTKSMKHMLDGAWTETSINEADKKVIRDGRKKHKRIATHVKVTKANADLGKEIGKKMQYMRKGHVPGSGIKYYSRYNTKEILVKYGERRVEFRKLLVEKLPADSFAVIKMNDFTHSALVQMYRTLFKHNNLYSLWYAKVILDESLDDYEVVINDRI